MSDDSNRDPLADMINVLAAPIAGGIRSVEQFQRGIGELFRAVDNLNQTLENLNETSVRVNRLLGEVEEPIRAMMPQLTRTIRAADEMTTMLEGPVRAAAPNIEAISDTLSSPGFSNLPNQLGDFMNTFGEVSKRLAPLTQFAENAGGLFGGLKLPGMPAPKPVAADDAQPAHEHPTITSTSKTTGTKTTGTRKPPAKKPAAKKAATKKPVAKKATRKSTAKGPATRS